MSKMKCQKMTLTFGTIIPTRISSYIHEVIISYRARMFGGPMYCLMSALSTNAKSAKQENNYRYNVMIIVMGTVPIAPVTFEVVKIITLRYFFS